MTAKRVIKSREIRNEGEVNMRDCGSMGLRCDYVNDRIGYFCTR